MSSADPLHHPTDPAQRVDPLDRAAAHARRWLDSLDERPVVPSAGVEEVLERLGSELPEHGEDPATVVDRLAEAIEPGLTGMPSGRFFGFVIGGTHPAALATDWLVSAWDQNSGLRAATPGTAAVETLAGRWLLDLLGLPSDAGVGFPTGATMANFTGLAAGRDAVLRRAGWDLARHALAGSPGVRVLAGAERHDTVDLALRFLGLGRPELVQADEQGRIRPDALAAALATAGAGDPPTLVVLQAGNLHSGAFDPFPEAIEMAHRHGAWVHVDGAFGLWAAANPATRHLTAGIESADSWGTDGHKWLNVPYDCGFAFCAHPEAHAASMSYTAAYLTGQGAGGLRAPSDYVLESSRRARGFATWAALRELGRSGVADLVERCCALARRFAEQLEGVDGVEVANDVVLNQVLVRFHDDDEATDLVVDRVQRSGECWMGATTWNGRRLMRISVSNWRTTAEDVDRSVAAIVAAIVAAMSR